MAELFKTIVITSPYEIENEANKIRMLLESGVDRVHIRKPDSSPAEVKELIEQIPYPLRRKLTLHGHFHLLDEMDLGGVHLNSRNPNAPKNALSISRSCHSVEEALGALDAEGCDYVTLSPIFDSISKEGYLSHFPMKETGEMIRGRRVVALGGVTPDKLKMLQNAGFFGAALLGYVWEGDFQTRLAELKHAINSLTQ